MTNRYTNPSSYKTNISKGDTNELSSKQGLIGKTVTIAGEYHRLFVANPLRGWKTITLSLAIEPAILTAPSGCYIYVCDSNTLDVDMHENLIDYVKFSSTTDCFSYYRSPISISRNEIIVIKSDISGVCARAEGNDDSRFGL